MVSARSIAAPSGGAPLAPPLNQSAEGVLANSTGSQAIAPRTRYRSRLEEWDTKASVRMSPRQRLWKDETTEKVYFIPELVPLAQHPEIVARGLSTTMLVEHLYTYLHFTTILEYEAINAVTQQIAHARIGIELPETMRIDAFKIYCDEGYHAYFCADLIQQVETTTGIPFRPRHSPPFLLRLRDLQASAARECPQLAEIFFAIVSETLITKTLALTAKDDRVVGAVRQVMADHARDEARHHAYFADLLEIAWPQLSPKQQAIIGPLLPQFILGFLEPNRPALMQLLTTYPLAPTVVRRIVEESYPSRPSMADVKQAAQATLRLLERHGVLAEPRTAEAFSASGLVDSRPVTHQTRDTSVSFA